MSTRTGSGAPRIESVTASAYTVPTDFPESDGTLSWDSTTIVVVRARAGGREGLGYTYSSRAAADIINGKLKECAVGKEATAIAWIWDAMVAIVRNFGRPGICASAIAAVDVAIWDLKARLLDLPLVSLLGAARDQVPAYASGGFTSYPLHRLERQLGEWTAAGFRQVKMKVGSRPADDVARVAAARRAVGPEVALYVDANGAYGRKQALAKAHAFARHDVTWFEEPVSSDDLEGLRLMRDRAPPGMDIAAGEYGYDLVDFRRMLAAEAVDVLQADATRCAGITGFMRAAALCRAHNVPLSAHTAPALHAHPACALSELRHVEYFHDHARIEGMFFDGCPRPTRGVLRPDLSRPGLGLAFREPDASRYAA